MYSVIVLVGDAKMLARWYTPMFGPCALFSIGMRISPTTVFSASLKTSSLSTPSHLHCVASQIQDSFICQV